MGYSLDFKKVQNFNEKLQYLIVKEFSERETNLADKYLVREYVEKKCGKEILPKLFAVYLSTSEINLQDLPKQFVLKTNNGCGNVFICHNKDKFNINECKKRLKKSLREDYSKVALEYQYKKIKPRIICEQYIDDGKNIMPLDYKFYCFDGKVKCILVCSNRERELKLDYYDLNWNYLYYAKPEYRSFENIEKPQKLQEMIDIAESLSEGMKFVRVDLYNIKDKIYFSELTFSPAAACIKYNTDEALNILGKYLRIEDENEK